MTCFTTSTDRFASTISINGGLTMSQHILTCLLIALLTIAGSSAAQAELIDFRNAVLADGPVGYWTLDETSGLVAADIANGLDGSYNGSIGLNVQGAFGPGSTGALFDGATAFVEVIDSGVASPLDVTNLTMEA